MKKSLLCVASLIAAVSASYAPHPSPPPIKYQPPHGFPRNTLGGAGGLGGLDPVTLLLLQKDSPGKIILEYSGYYILTFISYEKVV